MSEHQIIILPQNPLWIPPSGMAAATQQFIAGLFPAAEHIEVTCTDEVRYYDCGGNFEHIHCPACYAELSVEQWHSMMDADYNAENNSFAMQQQALPCCGELCNLNQLQYSFEQGFGRFAIIMDNSVGVLDAATQAAIEVFLDNQPVKIIYRH
ncbi:hypothetical protein M2404_002389 [Rheinheimera pacifica]|uniref:hypothetical protein n=1 Tax=Rheinheimera pacifica TaxID=173990 RepID=UPI0021674A4E|nr:hypothetical protein [Rheinheimera pacifica]MCS4308041.1 hypothetical protein [Rheinheimera pacifica]